jgi:glycosyltransferase involved in cell wall biosynthesis
VEHSALYAAFDRFPTRKGSSVHIAKFARALFDHAGGGLLYTLGADGLPAYQREDEIEIVRYSRPAEHFIERAAGFGTRLDALLEEHSDTLELCHFRDPWGGAPIVEHPARDRYAAVYEVNGLPSIELPFLYPNIPADLRDRIAALEQRCLHAADAVITPSRVTAEMLSRERGVAEERLHVIPNGADPMPDASEVPRPADAGRYLLYFGAVQPWQGLDTAIRALARLRDIEDLELVVCCSTHHRRAKPYRKLADKLEVADRIRWMFELEESELAPWRAHALLSLAPLRDCSRNVLQGCAPLKVIESLASGVPVVASDLPVVRELMSDGEHGRLVAPDRPSELARTIRVLLDFPQRRDAMAASAREHAGMKLTWERSTRRLRDLYSALAAKDDLMPAIRGDESTT